MSLFRRPLTEGPLGFPQTDRQAKALDALLRERPPDPALQYRKAVLFQEPTELLAGDRAEVSWISTEDPDRDHEVVRAGGLDDSHYQLNPIVTLNHCYTTPPVGRSLWRKRLREGERHGIKAKTHYPPRPASWGSDPWPPDEAFALVQAGLLRGKSIGFLPLEAHAPTDAEVARNPAWREVRLVIDRWLLLEYACVYLPAQPHAVVEAVSKSSIAFTPLAEIERAIDRCVAAHDVAARARQVVEEVLNRLQGRV